MRIREQQEEEEDGRSSSRSELRTERSPLGPCSPEMIDISFVKLHQDLHVFTTLTHRHGVTVLRFPAVSLTDPALCASAASTYPEILREMPADAEVACMPLP